MRTWLSVYTQNQFPHPCSPCNGVFISIATSPPSPFLCAFGCLFVGRGKIAFAPTSLQPWSCQPLPQPGAPTPRRDSPGTVSTSRGHLEIYGGLWGTTVEWGPGMLHVLRWARPLARVMNCPGFPGTSLVLAMKVLHPGKPPSPRQTTPLCPALMKDVPVKHWRPSSFADSKHAFAPWVQESSMVP